MKFENSNDWLVVDRSVAYLLFKDMEAMLNTSFIIE